MGKKSRLYRRWGKRAFDLMLGIPALIVLSPLMAVIAVLVRINLGSPVIFRQKRPGLHEKLFVIYKFRTMTDEREDNGKLLPKEQRITSLGKMLRKFSFDEIPELWNVIKGNISMVGPRPLRMEYLNLYTSEQSRRHEVKPGITGWSQVRGRNLLSWEEKFKHDVWYVDNTSFFLDLWILLQTVIQVLKRKGINAEGYATMPRFKGSNNLNKKYS
jgi:sugar transferase EpsL